MSKFIRPMAVSQARSVGLAALIGAALLVGPLVSARAETATTIRLAQAAPAANPAAPGTVEVRVANLRKALQITPDQEAKFDAVAQAMRGNAVSMDKMVAENKAASPESINAMFDLQTYQKFSQEHVDGLKRLLPAIEALYASMPDAQKKVADEVFHSDLTPCKKASVPMSDRAFSRAPAC